jgi:WD40 repeat protein
MDSSTVPVTPGRSPSSIRSAAVCRVFDDRPLRADGDVLAVAFAPDGGLWSVEDPGVLRRWDLEAGRQLDWYELSDLENLWAFSADGRVLASAGDDVSLWDPVTGQLQAVLPQPSWVTALALRADASLVATGHEDGAVRVWDAANDEQVWELLGHSGPVSALAFSADGSWLASAGEDRTIRVWELATGTEAGVLEGHRDRIPALVWHPRGHRLYSAGWDTAVWVWDLESCDPVILLNSHASQVTALAVTPDGRRLACADSGQAVHLWDLDTHRTVRVVRGFEGEARCLAFGPDGHTLALGGSDRVVHLWRPEHGAAPPSGEGAARGGEVRVGLAVSGDGSRLASLCPGRGVRLWDTATGQKLLELGETAELHAVACTPDGRRVAAGGADARLRLWDAQTGRRQALLEGPSVPITALAFAPAAPVLASASAVGSDVWLWNADRAEPALVIPDAADGCSVEALAFHPQGELLAVGGIDWMATGGSDGAVHVWDVVQPARVATLSGAARGVAFHPAGRLLAAASLARTVRVWDLSSGELLAELEGHDDAVTCVAYSPDGRWLASGGDDRTVRLWDARTGASAGLAELDTQVKAMCFAPDGRTLFTGNGNTSCYQLRVPRMFR